MTLANRLRKSRLEKGLTQKKIAEETGLKQGTIANYEKGKNVPSGIVLSKIATALDVPSGWLLDGGLKYKGRFIKQILEFYASKHDFKKLPDGDQKLEQILENIISNFKLAEENEQLQKNKQKLKAENTSLKSEIRELQAKIISLYEKSRPNEK